MFHVLVPSGGALAVGVVRVQVAAGGQVHQQEASVSPPSGK